MQRMRHAGLSATAELIILLRHLQWELATVHWFLNWGTISKFYRPGFLIFVLVIVSRDFELGRNVSCEEPTVSPVRG